MLKKNAGFTLIELMIVVAIIGILAAVAIPNFMNARDKARVSAGNSAVHSIRTGLEMYMVDNDCYPSVLPITTLANISNQVTNASTILNNFQGTTVDAYAGTINEYGFTVTCKDRITRTKIFASQDGIWVNEDANSDDALDGWVKKQ